MANVLKMARIDTIVHLHRQGWSGRRIARELDVDRETVARYLRAANLGSKPANAPIGSDDVTAGSKPAKAPIGSAGVSSPGPASCGIPEASSPSVFCQALTLAVVQGPGPEEAPSGKGRSSACTPWRAQIVAKLEQGLSAQRIYQDLVTEHGFAASYWSVRRYVRRLSGRQPLPFRRLECAAGEEVQVDFGSGAPVVDEQGRRRRPHIFRIVLSHSRKGYSEAVWRQTTENFLRCLENAFWHFGGVPQRLILDNLRAAVTRADWFDPDLNPKVQAFCQHYGIAALPTRPRTPRHKGKIERGIGYVKGNALKGRVFANLNEQNQHLWHWEETVADTRVHGTTRQQVGKVFVEVEKPALQALPAGRFPCFHEAQRKVHRDGHVEVDKAYYSVPPEYLGHTLWVRWDARVVRVFNLRLEQIAVHVKREPGRFSTDQRHLSDKKISQVERGASWLMRRVRCLGTQATRWAEAMIQVRGIEGVRVLQGLLSLAKRHSAAAIDRVCEIAGNHAAYRLRTLRQLLARDEQSQQGQFEFMNEHPLIRPLADYDQLVRAALQQGGQHTKEANA